MRIEDVADFRGDDTLSRLFPFIFGMEQKSPYIAGHSVKVASYSVQLATKAGLQKSEVKSIYFGALLHDVGKLRIPEPILQKPGPLTRDEYEVIQQHPKFGAEYIAVSSDTRVYEDIVRHHHERLDGMGYPDGLIASQISPAVRIVTIADAFDAMTSHRVYRKALCIGDALDELYRGAGTQFDPVFVALFAQCVSDPTQSSNTNPTSN